MELDIMAGIAGQSIFIYLTAGTLGAGRLAGKAGGSTILYLAAGTCGAGGGLVGWLL